jgi:hypothetical protein
MTERLFTDEDIQRNNELIAGELGQIVASFTIQKVPQGGAPDDVKEAWLGVSLPIRSENIPDGKLPNRQVAFDEITEQYNEINSPVKIYGLDAVMALDQAGKVEAAEYWLNTGFVLATLVFRANEGELNPLTETQ